MMILGAIVIPDIRLLDSGMVREEWGRSPVASGLKYFR